MTPLDERRSRRILEVEEDATLEDISAAYQLLKRIHGSDQGIFGGAGMEEFSPEARQGALEEIEAAHALLRSRFLEAALPPEDPPGADLDPQEPPEPQEGAQGPGLPDPGKPPEVLASPAEPAPAESAPAEPAPAAEEPCPPPALQTPVWRVRHQAGMSLDEVAGETHVPRAFLLALEEERFGDLPLAAVHVRGYLSAFLRALGADPEAFVPLYMERYQAWQGRR